MSLALEVCIENHLGRLRQFTKSCCTKTVISHSFNHGAVVVRQSYLRIIDVTVIQTSAHIINDRLNAVLDEHNILHNDQFGFRNGRNSTMCAVRHVSTILDTRARDVGFHCVFIDLRKAYDSVEHRSLVNSLNKYGFHEDVIELISMMIKNCRVRMKTEFGLTDGIDVTRGVRQGDIISPTLFLYLSILC